MNSPVTRTREEAWKLWIETLESGTYVQARGNLCRKTVSGLGYAYCCLGVLVDLAVKDGGEPWGEDRGWKGNSIYLSPDVQNWLGLTHDEQRYLSNLNDNQSFTFTQIAAELRVMAEKKGIKL